MINVHLICFQLFNPLKVDTLHRWVKSGAADLAFLYSPRYIGALHGERLWCVPGRHSALPMLESPNSCSISSCCWEDLILEQRKAELFTSPFLAFRASHSPPREYCPSEYVSQRLFNASWEQILVRGSSAGCLVSLQAEITPEWVGSMRVETKGRRRGAPRQLTSAWDRNEYPTLTSDCHVPSIWVSQQRWSCILLSQGGDLSRKVPHAEIIWRNGKKWAIYWPGDAFIFNCYNFHRSQWIYVKESAMQLGPDNIRL